jgi:iron only hydrogenase large subunit-like protein
VAGCINGAGQPRSKDKDLVKKRQSGMYDIDERRAIRQSHKNPLVTALYEEFLGSPNSHKVRVRTWWFASARTVNAALVLFNHKL